jgi:hypothetical protein
MNLSRPGPRGRYHSGVDLNEAFSSAMTLYTNLGSLVARDPDQEVQGPAIATVDAVLTACKELLPDHPVLSAVEDVISPEAIAAGGTLRVADLLPVVGQVVSALSSERSRRMEPPFVA